MKTLINYLIRALILTSALMVSVSYASDKNNEVPAYLYSVNNVDGNSAIVGYSISEDGSLEELSGSPFSTGGSGLSATLFTLNGIVQSEDGRYLFAVNPGSDDISVMRIGKDGNLRAVRGSPFPSGGNVPLSIAISDDILYVVHGGVRLDICDRCDYRGFEISGNGQLTPIEGSVIPLPETPASLPLAIQFDPEGEILIATRISFDLISDNANAIDTFILDDDTGLLTPAPGSPFINTLANNNTQPIGFAFNPVNESQLFVANTVNFPQPNGSVSTYLISDNGQIAELPGSPVSAGNGTIATCWVSLTSDGENMYATNTTSNSLSRFKVAPSGVLTLQETIDVPSGVEGGLSAPLEIVVTSNDKFVYMVNGDSGGIVGYEIDANGGLTLLAGHPVRIPDTKPFGLVVVDKK